MGQQQPEPQLKQEKRRIGIKDITFTASFVALMAVCSWITIAIIPPVPFTLQIFAIFAALLFLGGARGTAAITIFVALGAIGVPVFSNFTGGIDHIIGPTGGFIFGFIFMGLVYWLFEALLAKKKSWVWVKIIVLIGTLLLVYAIGTGYFLIMYASQGKSITLAAALMACVVPFIPADLGKLALALLLYNRLKRFVHF